MKRRTNPLPIILMTLLILGFMAALWFLTEPPVSTPHFEEPINTPAPSVTYDTRMHLFPGFNSFAGCNEGARVAFPDRDWYYYQDLCSDYNR